MSFVLPPLSHYLDDPATSSTATMADPPTVKPTKTKNNKGLTRSATLASRFKHTAESRPTSSLQRSLSVSASDRPEKQQQESARPAAPPPPPPPLPPLKQDGHWDESAPWEMYFDPNYTFFGGTVLDPRHRKRQQDVLKVMALHDYHLHLHPPPSAAASTAADQLQQPSLPYTVMDAVHHQHYAANDPPPPPPRHSYDDLHQNMSPASIQTMYYPAESSPTGDGSHMNQQDHQARLALLQAIRTESYHPTPATTTATATATNTTYAVMPKNKQQNTPKSASATTGVAVPASAMPSNRHRLYRDPTRYILMETPSPTQEEKVQASTTFDLTALQEAGHAPSPHKPGTMANDQERRASERRYRTSFLYFMFGFLFPPVWVIGALYTPPEQQQAYQSSQGRRIDLMWKRACRMAFALFTFGLLVMVVIILALNPGALGWRTSRTDLNSAQQFIPVVA